MPWPPSARYSRPRSAIRALVRPGEDESPVAKRPPDQFLRRLPRALVEKSHCHGVTASLIPLRVFGAACGHFIARYFRAEAYLVIEAAFRPSSRAPCLRVELFAGVGGTEQLGPVVVHKPFGAGLLENTFAALCEDHQLAGSHH
jgi:hypothetical protein